MEEVLFGVVWVLIISLIIGCIGDPDIIDAVIFRLMECSTK